jgi:hypothetical protein
MFEKHWECLLAWGDKLQLVIKGDGLECMIFATVKITHHDSFTNVKLCHYVKVWIIIIHNHAILKVLNIESLKNRNKKRKK